MKNVTIAHDDHGLSEAHEHWAKGQAQEQKGFFILNLEMPTTLPDLKSALYGPSVGDDPITEDSVSYERRNERPGPSRLIDKPQRPCRRMVIIGINAEDNPEIILFTAYGTQSETVAPREWWDSSMKPHEALESAKFWCEHALCK